MRSTDWMKQQLDGGREAMTGWRKKSNDWMEEEKQ
jgi:hypothetical protein